MNLGQRRRGTGSRSAPCPLGYRERVEGCNPLASSPSSPATLQDSLTPTTGRGKAPARIGRGGEETLASPPPQSCPPWDQGTGPFSVTVGLRLSPPLCARVPGSDCTCVRTCLCVCLWV